MTDPLAALKQRTQFVLYKSVPKRGNPDKLDKIPVDPRTLAAVDPINPGNHMGYAEAKAFAALYSLPYGVGFVFTRDDPHWLLDIDDCYDPERGDWTDTAKSLCAALAGCAVEVSVSGRGLHIIGSSALDLSDVGTRCGALGLEFYTHSRFVALTGTNAVGDAGHDSPGLAGVVAAHFTRQAVAADVDWTDGPVSGWDGYDDDDELIAAACASQSASSLLGGAVSFRDLWGANEAALSERYPDGGGRGRAFDGSQADAALAQHLAFWTGSDCERMQRLMCRSALARDKYERDDYLPRTIMRACGLQTSWHQRHQSSTPTQQALTEEDILDHGSSFLAVSDQIEFFGGCVYVRNRHAVYTPGGALLKPDVFKAVYGGYVFALDLRNTKCVSNAWQAFIENRAHRWPRVTDTVFDPTRRPGEIITIEQQDFVNFWEPVDVDRTPGDISPFTRHLGLLFPDARDREIILCYMAACVQHVGVKFQWCPLVQGTPGNGKTLLSRCVSAAVGQRYSYAPTAKELADKFNDWLYARVFIGVEDIYVPEHKAELIETLKPMITNDRLEIQGKGDKKEMREICANFFLNSNHRAGIQKSRDDRRFAIFYCPQQSKSDLARDGMNRDYFRGLYGWLLNGGYAIVSEYLHTYRIADEFNPARGDPAPDTSSTADAIREGLGSIEQEVLEAIETDEIGFRGGWVSSIFLGRLLDHMRAGRVVPPTKRREMMQTLGYDWHPALDGGRARTAVSPDGGKPRLYIRTGHISANLTDPAAVTAAYSAAQQGDDGRAAAVFNQGKLGGE